MIYDYTFLNDSLVKIKNLGVYGDQVFEEDEVDEVKLDESIKRLGEVADLFNESNPLGFEITERLKREKLRLERIKNRINNAK